MGYGESEAYRAGLYMTEEGYSFYGPEDEEDDDMAVEPMSLLEFVMFCADHGTHFRTFASALATYDTYRLRCDPDYKPSTGIPK